jgi:hypothetical protein
MYISTDSDAGHVNFSDQERKKLSCITLNQRHFLVFGAVYCTVQNYKDSSSIQVLVCTVFYEQSTRDYRKNGNMSPAQNVSTWRCNNNRCWTTGSPLVSGHWSDSAQNRTVWYYSMTTTLGLSFYALLFFVVNFFPNSYLSILADGFYKIQFYSM